MAASEMLRGRVRPWDAYMSLDRVTKRPAILREIPVQAEAGAPRRLRWEFEFIDLDRLNELAPEYIRTVQDAQVRRRLQSDASRLIELTEFEAYYKLMQFRFDSIRSRGNTIDMGHISLSDCHKRALARLKRSTEVELIESVNDLVRTIRNRLWLIVKDEMRQRNLEKDANTGQTLFVDTSVSDFNASPAKQASEERLKNLPQLSNDLQAVAMPDGSTQLVAVRRIEAYRPKKSMPVLKTNPVPVYVVPIYSKGDRDNSGALDDAYVADLDANKRNTLDRADYKNRELLDMIITRLEGSNSIRDRRAAEILSDYRTGLYPSELKKTKTRWTWSPGIIAARKGWSLDVTNDAVGVIRSSFTKDAKPTYDNAPIVGKRGGRSEIAMRLGMADREDKLEQAAKQLPVPKPVRG